MGRNVTVCIIIPIVSIGERRLWRQNGIAEIVGRYWPDQLAVRPCDAELLHYPFMSRPICCDTANRPNGSELTSSDKDNTRP